NYSYPDGNKIRPVPPIKTALGGLMIIGAYPSARFEKRRSKGTNRYRLIPIADNLQPLGQEEYFDGVSIRTLSSADGLSKYYLSSLGLTAEKCWITDLVKVFLYKESHIDSCTDVVPGFYAVETRTRFKELGSKSLSWINTEIEICKPRLVITLGLEVAQVISGNSHGSADSLLTLHIDYPVSIGSLPTLYCPHPEACRRYPKWHDHLNKQLMEIQKHKK
ncbi:MAG: hypothetical protein MUO76_10850, partial [Anaerolineaceae bacterium]|nr:hypothetical protein [Anaerolineaceae bacterium]